MKLCLMLFLTCFFTGISAVPAQNPDESRPRYGVILQGIVNIHDARFAALPGVPNCCPNFTGGTGFGPGAGFLAEGPIAGRWWIGARAMFAVQSAELAADEATDVLIDGVPRRGIFRHTLAAGLSSFAVEPVVMYNPIGRLRLFAGVRAAMWLTAEFNQKEVIADPNEGVFTDTRTRSRNERSGDIPALRKVQAGLLFGLTHDFPLNRARTMLIAPEVAFNLGLTNISDGVPAWKIHGLRFGFSLKFAPLRDTAKNFPAIENIAKEVEFIAENPQPKTESPPLATDNSKLATDNSKLTTQSPQLLISSFAADGRAEATARIAIEEFVSKQMRPLLNYVFFDENSAEIPDRYEALTAGEASGFRVESLRGSDVLPTYYHILNIIGRRMTERPSATLTLTGCNADAGDEQGNTALSGRRAEAVRRYFINVWGVAPGRISVKRRNKPEKPTASADAAAEAAAENRRVEITSGEAAILAPFISADTTRMAVTPSLRAAMANSTKKGVVFDIRAGGASVRKVTADTGAAVWNIALESSDALNALAAAREVKIQASAADGAAAEATVPVELTTLRRKRSAGVADREIDRYRLILFDFDNAGLTAANRSAIALIRENIRTGARVSVRGYTDRLGEEQHNRTLSEERARAAARALGLADADAAGSGETLLYDNDLPEGRFYSRTVHVTVETPMR